MIADSSGKAAVTSGSCEGGREDGAIRVTRHEQPSLDSLKALWSSLPGGALHTPFQSPGFVDAFQRHVAPAAGARSWILSASMPDTHELGALLPVIAYQRGPVSVLTMPDLGLADQNGPVLSRELAARPHLAKRLCDALVAALGTADLVDVQKIGPLIGEVDNPLFHLASTVEAGGILVFEAEDLATIETRFGKSVYKEARTKFRKLQQAGVNLVEVKEPAERLANLGMLLRQRADRFASLGREDSLQDEGRVAFYRALAASHDPDNPLKILALKKEQEVVATVALMAHGDIANGVLVSMGDPSWRRLSPGTVLLVQSILWARDRGIRSFSFGTGLQAYKQRFGAVQRPCRRLLLPTSLKGNAFVKALRAKQAARAILETIQKTGQAPRAS